MKSILLFDVFDVNSLVAIFCCVIQVLVIVDLSKRNSVIGSNSLFFREVESLEDYHELLYQFMFFSSLPVIVFKKKYFKSQNRFEVLTKDAQIGVIRTYSFLIDSVSNPKSKWTMQKQTCLFDI